MSKYRRKLIEVALPLEAINIASAKEKSIRHGHPSTLHLWWARRPLAACRAVLFSSLVNDPDDDPMYGIDEDTAATERAHLFDLIEELVQWKNSNNPRVINAARLEIARSIAANKVADKELTDDTPLVANAPPLPEEQAKYLPEPPPEYTPRDVRFKMPSLKPEQVNHFLAHYAPPVLDPFAGGGSIPLEAQRLGLRAYASDLNPIPVLINKALIEIPPKFGGQPPVNPDAQKGKLKSKVWHGAEGLAEDVRYYGKWIRDEAEKRIGHLYPKVKVTQEMADDGRPDLERYVGQELTVVAWLWMRTIPSPDPSVQGAHVPLLRSFVLSSKRGRGCWYEPDSYDAKSDAPFEIRVGHELPSSVAKERLVERSGGRCLLTGTPMPFTYVRKCAKEGSLKHRLGALVVIGDRERFYIPPTKEHVAAISNLEPQWKPDGEMPSKHRNFQPPGYGLTNFADLFLDRQLIALDTFSGLVSDVYDELTNSGHETEYASAVCIYLAFSLSKMSDRGSTICTWFTDRDSSRPTFARQAIQMTWDFAELNTLLDGSGSFVGANEWTAENIDALAQIPTCVGTVRNSDARSTFDEQHQVICTDPPYYDNIAYSELSDFFYLWLRRSLRKLSLPYFSTLLTPKSEELIASPHRHGGRTEAKEFFESGLRSVFDVWNSNASDIAPTALFYAFKQSEVENEGSSSTGWETMLEGLLGSGHQITATWPMRTELSNRSVGRGANALASSIVLVCRARGPNASMVTRSDFANALRNELPEAIKHLQSGNVAPVDLAQASIGPGMAVFSRYSKVVSADGSPMSVREALQLINQVLDESLVEQESDFDAETRFALKWFEQYGMSEGPFGDAESLSKAMAVSVKGIEDAGILRSKAGKVRLLKRDELNPNWDPATDTRLTMWEVTQYLIRTLESQGETGASDLLRRIGSEKGAIARELAYRLYQTCERKSLAKEAGAYNALVVSWPEISKLSRQSQSSKPETQMPMEYEE